MSEIPRWWRLKGQLLRLEGSNCQNCKILHFPPRQVCPDCGFDSAKPQKIIFENTKTSRPQDQQK